MKHDIDPFILEQQAYERIDQFSSEGAKAYFPKYYGVADQSDLVNRARYHRITEQRILVLELMRPSLRSRCICSNSIPAYLSEDLELLRKVSIDTTLSSLGRRYYESLFVDRLRRLTALHCIGVTHGDIKEEHFRLLNDFHDTTLFDFSRAYTITSERPCIVQGYTIDSRYASRWATWRSMQKLVKMERNHVRGLIENRCDFFFLAPVHTNLIIAHIG